jgi:hypothetical protein
MMFEELSKDEADGAMEQHRFYGEMVADLQSRR